jgi:hypothetical protein
MMSPNAEQALDYNMSRLQNFEHANVKLMQKEDDHKLRTTVLSNPCHYSRQDLRANE